MRISLVVAMTPERVIGKGGALPWRLPADMRHFRRLTMGHPVVMGRRTYESIGTPLPGRTNIVLSRDERFSLPGGFVARTPEQALNLARAALASSGAEGPGEVMVIGGAAVYAVFLPQAVRLYVTLVDAHLEGDTSFPALEPEEWKQFVESIRRASIALGTDQVKALTESDRRYRRFQKKSIVAACSIPAGEVISRDKVAFLRSDTAPGLSTLHLPELLDKRARRDIEQFEQIRLIDVTD